MVSSFLRGYLDWILEKKLFTDRVVRHWNGLPKGMVESPPLLMFEKNVDVAFGGMV